MIPLVGCRVRVIDGVGRGEEGVVSGVVDWRLKLTTMGDHDARMFVQGAMASHGENWRSRWFEASIDLDSGARVHSVSPRQIQIVTKELVRPDTFRSL